MALTTGQRDAVTRAYMRTVVGEPCAFVKSVLRTAVDNVDDWCDSAATTVPGTSYNASLNAGFRTTATSAQKAALLALVCWWRSGRTLPEGQ
ncbi:hypothetical protein Drose_06185 [Dactylosporangium roseum]|uniref:Uncharacterized protein n=1 Tax=Dactylosporangium roseum TaxID=47989 RepID=A0ABY5Z8H5_9ACTN|nr:hypothetical protein [Dactylosporangium roseum]UWZ37861.1 hypothetical protein Drose_06185 [Dactylosporangium roseum]